MKRTSFISSCLLVFLSASAFAGRASKLDALRNEYAVRFLQPDAHLQLAKYFLDAGNPLLAFYITEAARHRFERSQFMPAFSRVFLENNPLLKNGGRATENALSDIRRAEDLLNQKDPGTQAFLEAAIQKHPQVGYFYFRLGGMMQDQKKLGEAESAFRKAAELSPGLANILGWTGQFFFKAKNDKATALKYYLRAYFLDPDFYDTDYAEIRIRNLNWDLSTEAYDKLKIAKTPPETFLSDPNPVMTTLAITDMESYFKKDYMGPLVAALRHDDPNVRWAAEELLREKMDASFTSQLDALMKSPDLRVRGLSAYLAVHLLKSKGISRIEPWLSDKAELIRFDALSALLIEGSPEALAAAKKRCAVETHLLLLKVCQDVRP